MAKSKPKPLAYVEPPPGADASPPGRGVWSDTSAIAVVDDTRDALRQAILDALHRLPPELTETLPLRAFPRELSFDAWLSRLLAKPHNSPPRLMTSWWRVRQSFRLGIDRLLRDAGHRHLSEESATPQRRIIGTAELHVQKVWRFCPGHQSRAVVRAGILDDFTRALDDALDAAYTEVKGLRPRPFSRPNLDRDATRLALRRFLGLSDGQIRDYGAGYEVTLADGRVLVRPDLEPDDEEQDLLDAKAERRARDGIDQSIKNLECDAGLTFPSRRRGRPPKSPPIDDPTHRDYLAQDS